MRSTILLLLPSLVASLGACSATDEASVEDVPGSDVALDDRVEPEGPSPEEASEEPAPSASCDAKVLEELASIASGLGSKLAAKGAPGHAVVVSRRDAETGVRCVASTADGFARSGMDGYQPYTIDTRTPVGSVSKLVMAAVVLDVLDQHNVSLFTNIEKHLPSHWSLGTGVGDVTFHEVLRQRSGLAVNGSWSMTTAEMADWLTKPIGPKDYDYNNAGYLLLMFLTARVADPNINTTKEAGIWLDDYVRTKLMAPNGIPSGSAAIPSCLYDSAEVLAYPKFSFVTTASGGQGPIPDGRTGCGTAYLNASMRDLGLFADKLHHQEVFDPFWTFILKLNDYGLEPMSGCNAQSCPQYTGAGDEFQVKNGYLPFDETGGFKAAVGFFPQDTIVVFSMNGGDVGPSLAEAWDERVH